MSNTKSKPNVAETAVRNYIQYLNDPESVVDQDAVKAAEANLDAEADPIERLRLHAEVQRLREVDGEAVTAAFIDQAQAFAEAANMTDPAAAFTDLYNVPTKVLRAAGFKVRNQRSSGARVNRDTVVGAIPTSGTFTIREVAEKSGGSNASVRNVIKSLVDDGTVTEIGPDPDHEGKGKAPTLYQRS